jgi:hypothetical protein
VAIIAGGISAFRKFHRHPKLRQMKKVTLTFPSYDSLWLFKDQTKAIHIQIKPRDHVISGLFDSSEIEMAVRKFQAAPDNQEDERR